MKLNKLIALIRALSEQKFFGELVIKFQNGEIVHGLKTESISFLKEKESS